MNLRLSAVIAAAANLPALPFQATTANTPAYITFTSGSTGQPKPVLAPVGQVENRFAWMWRRYPFADGEVCCLRMPLSFIDSLWELLGPVCVGTPVALLSARKFPLGEELVSALARHRVSRVWMLPAAINSLLESFPDLEARLPALRFWVTTGDAIAPGVVGKFFAALPHAKLFNLYGTSEVWDATWHEITRESVHDTYVPIGTSIDGVEVSIVDPRGLELPAGEEGEIAVSGTGLAIGYIGGSSKDCDDFLSDITGPNGSKRCYRTGDLGVLRASGPLVFLGRRSSWVETSTGRVSLLAIEAALSLHPDIAECAAVSRSPSTGGAQIVGYYCPKLAHAADADDLRCYLKSKLPAHNLPDKLVRVANFPMTPSGKIDRARLA